MLSWINDSAPYGVITTDLQFRIQRWNSWMETHSGRPSADVLQRSLFEIFPDLLKRNLGTRFDRALLGETSILSTGLHGYLVPLPFSSGGKEFTLMQQTARVAPLVVGKQIHGVIVVIEDVTEREVQALVMRRQHERDEILSWALGHLLKSGEPRRTMREVFYKVAEFLDFDMYLLYLFEPGGVLKLHAEGGISPELQKEITLIGTSHPLWVPFSIMERPRIYEEIDLSKDNLKILSQRIGIRACVVLPLLVDDRPLGALCFGTRSRAALLEGEPGLLSTIAQYVAVAIHREGTALQLHAAQLQLREYAQGLEKKVSERTERLLGIIAELETFSYTLAHDLRAPIRALTGYCEVLVEDFSTAIPEDANRIISKLANSCQRLDVLTKDLLEFSKVSRQEVKLSAIDVEAVVSDVISMSSALPDGSIAVCKPLYSVVANRTLLQQCLSNLLDNAVKFTKPGTLPKIVLSTELVTTAESRAQKMTPFNNPLIRSETVALEESPSRRVRIIVEDNGIGVPEEDQQKIFGIFDRGSAPAGYEGTGIGLAIVARAMQRMGGTCGVKSETGAGSRFWLEFPGG